MIKWLMKFQVQTNIKNADGSLKWMSDIAALQVYATRFWQMLHNQLLKMSFHLLLHFKQQLLQYQTQQQLPRKTRRRKTQKNIEILLEQVLSNSGTLLSSFRKSTNILKNMDRNFVALLETF